MNKPKAKTTGLTKLARDRIKYQAEIKAWNKADTLREAIHVLADIKAPQAAFVEIGIAAAVAVLPVFEKSRPDDPRSRKAIEALKALLRRGTKIDDAIVHDTSAAAWIADRNASYAAWSAYYALQSAQSKDTSAYYAYYAVSHAVGAGLRHQRAIRIIKRIGHKYFAFLSKR
jgi:hypothetical protein